MGDRSPALRHRGTALSPAWVGQCRGHSQLLESTLLTSIPCSFNLKERTPSSLAPLPLAASENRSWTQTRTFPFQNSASGTNPAGLWSSSGGPVTCLRGAEEQLCFQPGFDGDLSQLFESTLLTSIPCLGGKRNCSDFLSGCRSLARCQLELPVGLGCIGTV